ncbi:hypothetical protein AQV86_04960 [Nanohaloarchaea archaeon SG9]|nr:hypothetical protein AQV86_04960 [Nanohaloarchaea archaeon SG9]
MNKASNQNAFYTVYRGGLEDLSELATEFCLGEYGDRCEFYEVSIQRTHPDDHVWTVHEFPSFDSRAVRAIKHHLKARRDVVKLEFGSEQRPNMEIRLCKARNTNVLARYLSKDEREGLDEDDLVVLAVNYEELGSEAERFIQKVEGLENKE